METPWRAQAQQRCLQRTLVAMMREALLPQIRTMQEGGASWPLDGQRTLLLECQGGEPVCDNLWQDMGELRCRGLGTEIVIIETAPQLLRLIALTHAAIDAPAVERLVRELENSVANDALAMAYREAWGRQLKLEHAAGSPEGFLGVVRGMAPAAGLLLLEQWGAQGHPTHPTHKAKLGMSEAEVVAYSPEFGARLRLVLAAIRRDCLNVSLGLSIPDYVDWFAEQWPQIASDWRAALALRGMEAADWLPLPLHPWQAANSVPLRFASLLEQDALVLLDEVQWPAAPTMSFRTMSCEQGEALPHIKLPVSLWLTSAERTVSPKSTVMGPRLTALLREVLAREAGLRQKLDIVDELVGLHYRHPEGDDDIARHLSVLFRRHPASLVQEGELAVPVGALFAPSPFHGRLLATDAVAQAFGDHGEGALAFYAGYLDMALQAVLQPYLQYGIALEAHQQNSFVVLDAMYRPVRLLVRDFGDVRVHAPTLQAQGLTLQPYRQGFTLYEDNAPVRDKVMHAFLLCHMIELGRALAHAYGQPSRPYVELLRKGLENLFAQLQPEVDAERWQAERQALLEDPWPAKSFLRMRLNNSSEDVVLRMPNPLRLTASATA